MKDQEYFKLFEEREGRLLDKELKGIIKKENIIFMGKIPQYNSKISIAKNCKNFLMLGNIFGQKEMLSKVCKAKISQAKIEKRKQIKMLEEELNWLIKNRDTRIKILIDTETEKLGGLLYEFNSRIEKIENKIKQLQEEFEHE